MKDFENLFYATRGAINLNDHGSDHWEYTMVSREKPGKEAAFIIAAAEGSTGNTAADPAFYSVMFS